MFIKLTSDGKEFIGNVNLLKRVFITPKGKVAVVGWSNNGYYIEVDESYEEVVARVMKVVSSNFNCKGIK